jgi:RimJ/RimL family protein N-acetyltransferase
VTSESIIEGQFVRLRPMDERDLPSFVEWLKDEDLTRWLGAISNSPTLEEEVDWYHGRREDPDCVLWSIETLDGALIGSTELRLSPFAHRAELGIAIHDRSSWNRGYGTDAVRCVLRYAFEDLELNRVELTTDADNSRAIRCYEKCGFVSEGRLRQHRIRDDGPADSLIMSVLRKEWRNGGLS